MRQLIAFTKKEFLDQYRSGKLFILGAVFLFFGIMSPAMAKLTPKLLEILAKQDTGFVIDTAREVSALDSFDQFFKNMSTCLIVFVIMQAGIFTKEYSSGTLMLSLTKGMKRSRVIIAKAVTLIFIWTVCYAVCFGVCCGYTAYFWDISVAKHLMTAVLIYWIYGLFFISLIVFFSSLLKTNTAVIVCVAGVYLSMDIILGLIPKVKDVIPTKLAVIGQLIHGEDIAYAAPLAVTIILSAAFVLLSVPIFNKKQI